MYERLISERIIKSFYTEEFKGSKRKDTPKILAHRRRELIKQLEIYTDSAGKIFVYLRWKGERCSLTLSDCLITFNYFKVTPEIFYFFRNKNIQFEKLFEALLVEENQTTLMRNL